MRRPQLLPVMMLLAGSLAGCATSRPLPGVCPDPPREPSALQNLPPKGTGQKRLESYLSEAVILLERLPPSGTTP